MKQMKYMVLVFFVFLNTNVLFGQKKLYEKILDKVEANVDKNYYSESIFAVRHSEYIVNDLTKDFEKVVCVEYFPTPMWAIDEKFYNQKFGFNNSIFPLRMIGYLTSGKLYEKDKKNNLGFTVPHRFASSFSRIDINSDFHSSLINFVMNNRTKRKDSKNNISNEKQLNKINIPLPNPYENSENQKPKISIEYENINNGKISNSTSKSADNTPKTLSITSTPIYTRIADSITYEVDDVTYMGIDCYRLVKINMANIIYTDFERQRFENTLANEFPNLSEQQKNEFKQHIEYWANGKSFVSQTYTVAKKNFAILLFQREVKQQNSKGEWLKIEKITENYQEGKDKKHHQTSYIKLIRNYKGSSPNIDNFLTLVVRTALERDFSLDSTTIIPRNPYLAYEDFCEKVDVPDEDMLLDWNQYEE